MDNNKSDIEWLLERIPDANEAQKEGFCRLMGHNADVLDEINLEKYRLIILKNIRMYRDEK